MCSELSNGNHIDFPSNDGMYDGMSLMRYRTTFSLDRETMGRLKKLSARWRVSQAEVVRRALLNAEASVESEVQNPVDMLQSLLASGEGLNSAEAEAYLVETREVRKSWRGE